MNTDVTASSGAEDQALYIQRLIWQYCLPYYWIGGDLILFSFTVFNGFQELQFSSLTNDNVLSVFLHIDIAVLGY